MGSYVICSKCFAILLQHNCNLHTCISLSALVKSDLSGQQNVEHFVDLTSTCYALLHVRQCALCVNTAYTSGCETLSDRPGKPNKDLCSSIAQFDTDKYSLIINYVKHCFDVHQTLPLHVCRYCGSLYLLPIAVHCHENYHM